MQEKLVFLKFRLRKTHIYTHGWAYFINLKTQSFIILGPNSQSLFGIFGIMILNSLYCYISKETQLELNNESVGIYIEEFIETDWFIYKYLQFPKNGPN